MESQDSEDEIVRSILQQVSELVLVDNLAAMEDHIQRIVLREEVTETTVITDWRTPGSSLEVSRNGGLSPPPPPPHLHHHHHHQPVPVQFYLASPPLSLLYQSLPQQFQHLPHHLQSASQNFQQVTPQFQSVPAQLQNISPQLDLVPPEPETESGPPLPPNSLFRNFDPYQMSLSPSSGSSNSRSRRPDDRGVCGFCKKNGESEAVFRGHRLRQEGRVVCPQLRMMVCEFCGATGDQAHTRSYCPHLGPNNQQENVSRLLRMTNKKSNGKIRRKFGK